VRGAALFICHPPKVLARFSVLPSAKVIGASPLRHDGADAVPSRTRLATRPVVMGPTAAKR
jgi:hypothetical protein